MVEAAIGVIPFVTQCAAVITQRLEINAPPHEKLPLIVRATCHGQAPVPAGIPPTMGGGAVSAVIAAGATTDVETTRPLPVPDLLTLSRYEDAALALNVAVTERAALKVVTQLPVPEQAPDQPVKVEPPAATAVSVTLVPELKLALQMLPQLMPAGLLVTVPAPVPALDTPSV